MFFDDYIGIGMFVVFIIIGQKMLGCYRPPPPPQQIVEGVLQGYLRTICYKGKAQNFLGKTIDIQIEGI